MAKHTSTHIWSRCLRCFPFCWGNWEKRALCLNLPGHLFFYKRNLLPNRHPEWNAPLWYTWDLHRHLPVSEQRMFFFQQWRSPFSLYSYHQMLLQQSNTWWPDFGHITKQPSLWIAFHNSLLAVFSCASWDLWDHYLINNASGWNPLHLLLLTLPTLCFKNIFLGSRRYFLSDRCNLKTGHVLGFTFSQWPIKCSAI